MGKKKITEDMTSDWVGNHGYSGKRDDWMLTTLTEIANGGYTSEQLYEDISHYADQWPDQ